MNVDYALQVNMVMVHKVTYQKLVHAILAHQVTTVQEVIIRQNVQQEHIVVKVIQAVITVIEENQVLMEHQAVMTALKVLTTIQ